jgi:hypothetical protein
MSVLVEDVATLERYLQGIMNRSEHHAKTVGAVALALLGAILWRKDETPLKVGRYRGTLTNVVRFAVDGNNYVLRYNHGAGCIELKDGTLQGEVLYSFTNKTKMTEVRAIFGSLGH